MKAYSNDLRQKIIEAVKNNEGTIFELAKRFNVSESFINRLIRRVKKTGSIEPTKPKRNPQIKYTPGIIEIIRNIINENKDISMNDLLKEFVLKVGFKSTPSVMSTILKKNNIFLKRSFRKKKNDK